NSNVVARLFLVEDALLPTGTATPTRFDGPRDAGPAAVVHRALPLRTRLHVREVSLGTALTGHIRMIRRPARDAPLRVRFEPRAHLGAKRPLLVCLFEIHNSLSPSLRPGIPRPLHARDSGELTRSLCSLRSPHHCPMSEL